MKRWEIYLARVPFEDVEETKVRPVLIWNDLAYVIAFKMTSADRGDNDEEYQVKYWKEAGLTKPTSIRIKKLLKLSEDDLVQKMGVLDKRDQLRFSLRVAP